MVDLSEVRPRTTAGFKATKPPNEASLPIDERQMCLTTIVHLTNRAPTVVRLTSVNLDADIRK